MIKEDPLVSLEEAKQYYPEIQCIRGKNLKGLQVGSLKILYKTNSELIGKTKKAMWVCYCENCNNVVKRRADYLYQKRINSCGCLNFPGYIDISNNKYGKLTALNLSHYDKNNGYIWNCICDCGNKHKVSYSNLNTQRIIECPKCSRRKAMIKLGKEGSKKIKEILKNNNISFELEWNYSDLKDKNFLFYDFYLPDYNILIEYDGEQHFIEGSKNSTFNNIEKHEIIIKHDKMKNEYAINNDIPLIRIPYWEKDNITLEDLLINSKFKIN